MALIPQMELAPPVGDRQGICSQVLNSPVEGAAPKIQSQLPSSAEDAQFSSLRDPVQPSEATALACSAPVVFVSGGRLQADSDVPAEAFGACHAVRAACAPR